MKNLRFALLFGLVLLGSQARAELPPAAFDAAKKWNAKFEPFKKEDYSPQVQSLFDDGQSPALLRGDFNGDKLEDYAVMAAVGPKQEFAVAILSDKKNPSNWTVVPIEEYDFDPMTYKSGKPTGQKDVPLYVIGAKSKAAERYRRLKGRELIQIEAFGGTVDLYSVDKNKAAIFKSDGP